MGKKGRERDVQRSQMTWREKSLDVKPEWKERGERDIQQLTTDADRLLDLNWIHSLSLSVSDEDERKDEMDQKEDSNVVSVGKSDLRMFYCSLESLFNFTLCRSISHIFLPKRAGRNIASVKRESKKGR